MTQYQYTIVNVRSDGGLPAQERVLTEYAKAGWRLVSALGYLTMHVTFYFERVVE